MNVYCEKPIYDSYQRNMEQFQPQRKEYVETAPVLSIKKLYKDYDLMCRQWKLQVHLQVQSHGIKGWFKKVIKQMLAKSIGWMLLPNLEAQSAYNLSMVHVMGDVLKLAAYMDAAGQKSLDKPNIIICRDRIVKESRLQEILLVFQYYQIFVDANASLIFLAAQLDDSLYLEFLQRTISELQLRTVQFVVTEDSGIQAEYMQKADLEISLAEKEEVTAALSVPLLQYSPVKENKEHIYFFDEIDLEGISVLIKTVIDHERKD